MFALANYLCYLLTLVALYSALFDYVHLVQEPTQFISIAKYKASAKGVYKTLLSVKSVPGFFKYSKLLQSWQDVGSN
jgi:hypothetical protein